MGIALPSAIAGRLHAHETRVLTVLHIADQDAILDQHGAIAGRALVVDRKGATAVRDRAVVDHGDALGGDPLPHQAGEGRGFLAVEITFQAVADGFVQHDAGPARSKHHVHLTCRCWHCLEIDQRLADGIVGRALPGLRLEEAGEALASAVAVAASLLAVTIPGDDRDVDAHQRAHVAVAFTVAAQNLDHLPARAERDRNLAYARVLGPNIGVDRLEQTHLGLEVRGPKRVVIAIKANIGAAGRLGIATAVSDLDSAHRVRRPCQRRLRELRGVCIADRLVLDGAEPETLVGIVGRLLEPAVVEHEHLGLGIFEIEFAVVGAFETTGKMPARVLAGEAGTVEKRHGGRGHERIRNWRIWLKIVVLAATCEVAAPSIRSWIPERKAASAWPTAACRSPRRSPSGSSGNRSLPRASGR